MIWPFRKKKPDPVAEPVKKKERAAFGPKPDEYPKAEILAPVAAGVAMDSKFSNGVIGLGSNDGIPQEVGAWYASQGYIGPLQASWIARHWLVDKAINMPARDSLRQGWELETEDEKLVELMESADKKHKISSRLHEFVAAARRTGGAVAVLLTCPDSESESEYYEHPLNLEAVTEYHGIAIIDAVDASPLPDQSDLNDPASIGYMMPSYFQIGTKRYHKSHCVTLVPFPVSGTLKPSYKYFGQSLPERIYERVYAAERTANEAPLLAMTKRLRLLGVDIESVVKGGQAMEILEANVRGLQQIADNFGVFVYDTANGGGMSQLDTALGDFDALVMTQYQLVAAIAEVPSTKLLGTSPKGFNATGDAEAEDYRQALESIQTHDLQPLLEKHYQTVAQINEVEAPGVVWAPLDSPTAKEFAEIDQMVGGTIAQLVAQGVIMQEQALSILTKLKDSMFAGIEQVAMAELNGEADGLLDQVLAELEAEGMAQDKKFDESNVKRDSGGRFSESSGSAESTGSGSVKNKGENKTQIAQGGSLDENLEIAEKEGFDTDNIYVHASPSEELETIDENGNFPGLFSLDKEDSGQAEHYGDYSYEYVIKGEPWDDSDISSAIRDDWEGTESFIRKNSAGGGDLDDSVIEKIADIISGDSMELDQDVMDALNAIDEADFYKEAQAIRMKYARDRGAPAVRMEDEFGDSTVALLPGDKVMQVSKRKV